MNGSFALVRMRGRGESKPQWLMIKHRDRFASSEDVTVTRTALQNAAEVAILLLTTDCIVVEKPKKKDAKKDAKNAMTKEEGRGGG